jgi:hypothetical protein
VRLGASAEALLLRADSDDGEVLMAWPWLLCEAPTAKAATS